MYMCERFTSRRRGPVGIADWVGSGGSMSPEAVSGRRELAIPPLSGVRVGARDLEPTPTATA